MSEFLENKDTEDEYLIRREIRRQRRLEQKRRREKRLRIIKIVLAIAVICIIVLCIGIGIKRKQKTEQGNTTIQSQTSEVDTQSSSEDGKKEDEAVIATQPIQFKETDNTKSITSETIESTSAILIDADTDTIIGKKNAYDKIIPASMTKVLTLLVAAEAIDEADLDDTFTMTLEITDYAYVNDCSSVGFLADEVVTVKDLLYGTVLASGGDAAVGLATYVAGSHEAFVEKMNKKAEQLGISDTSHFTNCVGIHDDELYSTPYDMAVIMKAAMQNNLCKEILRARTYTTTLTTEHPEGITISNWFIRRIEDKDTGGEVMGAKTGYVVESGNCAVSYQKNSNGTTYICVTANAESNWICIYDQVELYSGISGGQ